MLELMPHADSGSNVLLIHLLILVLDIYCLLVLVSFPIYAFFLTFSLLVYSLIYLFL